MHGNTFPYSEELIETLELAFSTPRFERYLTAQGGDRTKAAQLYVWNTAASSALYGPLQCCEIALRNAVHRSLSGDHGDRWFDSPIHMRAAELSMAKEAARKLDRRGVTPVADRIVAELSFGYRVGLFSNKYDQTLWRTHLHRLFTPRPKRRELHEDLERLRTLRNRIAHHEPLINRKLMDDHERISRVLGGMTRELQGWVRHHSRVADVVATDPADLLRF